VRLVTSRCGIPVIFTCLAQAADFDGILSGLDAFAQKPVGWMKKNFSDSDNGENNGTAGLVIDRL